MMVRVGFSVCHAVVDHDVGMGPKMTGEKLNILISDCAVGLSGNETRQTRYSMNRIETTRFLCLHYRKRDKNNVEPIKPNDTHPLIQGSAHWLGSGG